MVFSPPLSSSCPSDHSSWKTPCFAAPLVKRAHMCCLLQCHIIFHVLINLFFFFTYSRPNFCLAHECLSFTLDEAERILLRPPHFGMSQPHWQHWGRAGLVLGWECVGEAWKAGLCGIPEQLMCESRWRQTNSIWCIPDGMQPQAGGDTSWEAPAPSRMSLWVLNPRFAGGRQVCSPLKHPFPWSLRLSFLECHLPDL